MRQDTRPATAVIGLGVMGRAIANHLISLGRPVRGYDVNPETLRTFAAGGGIAASSPAEAARGLGNALVIVHNEAQVDAVLFGPGGLSESLGNSSDRGIIWLASTVSPGYVRGLQPRLAEYDIRLLDGPVSGGPIRAGRGELSIFLGGDEQTIAAIRPLLSDCAARLLQAGPVGAASCLKLINQILTASNIALTAEALALGERAGIDPQLLITAITQSAGTSRQFEQRAPRMAAADHHIDATIRTFEKDLTIAVQAAHELGAATPLAAAARSVFHRAGELGLLDESDTMLVDAYRNDFEPAAGPEPRPR